MSTAFGDPCYEWVRAIAPMYAPVCLPCVARVAARRARGWRDGTPPRWVGLEYTDLYRASTKAMPYSTADALESRDARRLAPRHSAVQSHLARPLVRTSTDSAVGRLASGT